LYASQRLFSDALTQLEIFLKNNPDNKKANIEIGNVYLDLDKPEVAKKYFQKAFNSNDLEEISHKEFQSSNSEKFLLFDDKFITIRSRISWRVADPLLYAGSVGNEVIAETRINDYYTSLLIPIVATKTYSEVTSYLGKDVENMIINKLNVSKLRKHFGIEVISLNIEPKSANSR
jgi:tetratricopeptide (TPR) repeat protein